MRAFAGEHDAEFVEERQQPDAAYGVLATLR
jgi:hypothetical protein